MASEICKSGAVTPMEPRSITATIAQKYGMEAKNFEATLRATVVPEKCTREEFAAFLMVADKYKLNPILKEIYAFPKKGGGIQPIVSVDGWSNIINSHPACDGFDFEDHLDTNGALLAITCRIYRKDRSRPTETREYMVECLRGTDVWKQWPRRMLRHKALIQAARYAFGFTGIVDPDEYERMTAVERPAITIPSAISLAIPADLERTADEAQPAPADDIQDAIPEDPEDVIGDLQLALAHSHTAAEVEETWDEMAERIALAGRDVFLRAQTKYEARMQELVPLESAGSVPAKQKVRIPSAMGE